MATAAGSLSLTAVARVATGGRAAVGYTPTLVSTSVLRLRCTSPVVWVGGQPYC